MNICVVGAGAVGGYLGVRLALSGQNVTFVDQGAHLEAIKRQKLKLQYGNGSEFIAEHAKATGNMHECGVQDFVILGVKTHQIENIAANVSPLLGPHTTVITIQNGIPWWYFKKHGGEFDGCDIKSVDPNGIISASIDADRIIGCVAYCAAEVTEPGVIRHVEGIRFPVGELDGGLTERVKRISEMLEMAGFKSRILHDIRAELWLKLWGALSFNPISALSHSTLADICGYPATRDLAELMMREAEAVATKLGIAFRVSLEKRISGAKKVGHHKTSMLQDVEKGNTLEVDALLGAVVELGDLTGTPVPNINAVYACVKLLDKTIRENRIFIRGQQC